MDWTEEAIIAEGLDPKRYEIVDGALVAVRGKSRRGARVLARLTAILNAHAQARSLGEVYGSPRYELQAKPRRERLPDVSFETWQWIARDPPAPELAIEVLSPSDSTSALKEKAEQFIEAGCREVWIVDPELETIAVLGRGPTQAYAAGDTLESPVLPGLALPVAALFAPPPRPSRVHYPSLALVSTIHH